MSVKEQRYGTSTIETIPSPADAGDLTIDALSVVGTPTSSAITLGVFFQGKNVQLQLAGSFSYPNGFPKTGTEVKNSGVSIDAARVLVDGVLVEETTFSSPVHLFQFLFATDNSFHASLMYSGSDTFIGSLSTPIDGDSDVVNGFGGNDTFFGNGSGRSDDVFYGGNGIDTSVLRGKKLDYTILAGGSIWNEYTQKGELPGYFIKDKVAARDGQQQINGVERLKFSDGSLALDVQGNAGIVAKVIGVVFGKDKVANKEYMGIGLDLLDSGMNYIALGALALNAAGLTTPDQIVSALWTNLFGTAPSDIQKVPFVQLLQQGMSPGELARIAAETTTNATNIDLVGLGKVGIDYIPIA